jgi:hypothetical protein
VVLPAIPIWRYLFRQDQQILAAALWATQNTNRDDLIVFRANHRWDMADYPNNPVPAYYSQRATFIWTRNTGETYRQMGLQRASYAIVTVLQKRAAGPLEVIVNRFRAVSGWEPESTEWLERSEFRPFAEGTGFVVFKKQ